MGNWGDYDVMAEDIYYLASTEPGAEIRFLSFETGNTTTLGKAEKRTSFGLAAAPDNSSVLYTQYDSEAIQGQAPNFAKAAKFGASP